MTSIQDLMEQQATNRLKEAASEVADNMMLVLDEYAPAYLGQYGPKAKARRAFRNFALESFVARVKGVGGPDVPSDLVTAEVARLVDRVLLVTDELPNVAATAQAVELRTIALEDQAESMDAERLKRLGELRDAIKSIAAEAERHRIATTRKGRRRRKGRKGRKRGRRSTGARK